MIVNKWIHPAYVPREDDALEVLISLLESGTNSIALMGYSGCGKHAVLRQAVQLMARIHEKSIVVVDRDALSAEVRPPPNSIVTLSADAELAVSSFKDCSAAWHGLVEQAATLGCTAVSCIPYERDAESYEATLYIPGVETTYSFVQQWMAGVRLTRCFKTEGLLHLANFVDGNLHVLSFVTRALLKAKKLSGLTGRRDALTELCLATKKTVEKSVHAYDGLADCVASIKLGELVDMADQVDLWKIGVVAGIVPSMHHAEAIEWKSEKLRLRNFML